MSTKNRNLAKKQAAREEKKRRAARRQTILLISAAIAVVAAVVAAVLLSQPRYAAFAEQEGGWLLDKSTGIRYFEAPSDYEPVSYTRKPYGRLGKRRFYPLTGQSPGQWLTEDVYGICSLLCAEGTVLPTLAEFEADTIHVCHDGETVTAIATITEAADVAAVTDAVLNGETAALPAQSEAVYTLRFASGTYSWFYYNVVFVVTEEGNFYYDRGTGRAVPAGTLVETYIRGALESLNESGETGT